MDRREREGGQPEMPIRLISLGTGELSYFTSLREVFRRIAEEPTTAWYIRASLEIGIDGGLHPEIPSDLIFSSAEPNDDCHGPFWVDTSDPRQAYIKATILGNGGLSPEDLLQHYIEMQRTAIHSLMAITR